MKLLEHMVAVDAYLKHWKMQLRLNMQQVNYYIQRNPRGNQEVKKKGGNNFSCVYNV